MKLTTKVTSFEGETTPGVRRSPAEIQVRMAELEKLMAQNDIWIHTGLLSKIPEPESRRKRDLLRAKLYELQWILGKDIDVREGVHYS